MSHSGEGKSPIPNNMERIARALRVDDQDLPTRPSAEELRFEKSLDQRKICGTNRVSGAATLQLEGRRAVRGPTHMKYARRPHL